MQTFLSKRIYLSKRAFDQNTMSVWEQCDDTVNVQGLVDEEIAVQRREDDECGSDHEEEDGGVDDGTLTEVTIEDIATGRALACADSSPPPTSPAAKRTCTEKASNND